MNINITISKKAKDSIIIVCIGIILGLLYPLLSREYDDIGALTNGAVIGLIGSSFIVFNEIFYIRVFVRQMKFRTLVIYKSILYSVFFILIILIVVSSTRAIEQNKSLISYIGSSSFYDFIWHEDFNQIVIYALAITTIFIFVHQISKKMGSGILWNFISGNYHNPREEERIFMFMDLNNSTTLAEDLGDIEYNKLLNNFFFDITDSIITNYGEIYRYVGDEVVVSWKLKKGLKKAYCLRTFFQAKRAIHLNREKYLKSYGLVPSFSAGFHMGKVIVGEIGEIKSQISFIGNVMYETSEIEKSCRKHNAQSLISQTLLNLIKLPSIYSSNQEGILDTSGANPIQLFSIVEK